MDRSATARAIGLVILALVVFSVLWLTIDSNRFHVHAGIHATGPTTSK
jgi:hypothetical protein